MKKLIVPSLLYIFFLFTNPLFSQETQVPMDKDGKVTYIDSALNNNIEVFTTYNGFIEARLFMLTDSTFSMEVYYMQDEKYSRKRVNMNLTEVENLRTDVTRKLQEKTATTINQNGRSELLWGLSIAGLGLYGPAAVYVSDTDGSTAVGLYMLTAAASFFVPYYLTGNSVVSDGAARLGVWGSYSGAGHGLLLYKLFGSDKTITEVYDGGEYTYTRTNDQTLWGFIALASIAEAYAGYRIAQDFNFSAGKSDMMINTSVAGTAILPGLLYVAGVEDEKSLYGTAILGTFAGYAMGNYITNTQNYSRGDAICFTNAWVLGAAVPLSILALAKSEEPKAYVGTAILGAGAGMLLGNYLVKGRDFSTSQGVYMSLASFGGAFVTGGVAFLAIGDIDENWKYIPAMVTLGAIGGYLLTYSVMEDDPKIKEKNLSGDLKLDFNPLALAAPFSKSLNSRAINFYSPFLSIIYKF